MKGNTFILFTIVTAAALWLGGCSKDTPTANSNDISASLSSLSQLPSADGMLTGTGANSSITYKPHRVDNMFLGAINLQSVSGTPPILKDITSTSADTYFWGGLVADVNANWDSKTNDQKTAVRNQFWGQDVTTPGPGGHGSCMMAQSVAESLSRIGDAAGTMCYMKGITKGPVGTTFTGTTASEAFTQTAADRIIKIDISGMQFEGQREVMSVYFKVYGSNTVTADKYKYDMWMCKSGTVTDRETMDVTKSTGVMVSTMTNGQSGNIGSMSLTMNLKKDANGNITIDPAKDRTAESKFKGTWGTFASKVTLTSKDWIYGWRYNNSDWGTDYNFSIAAFKGTTADTFSFLQGAFKGSSGKSGATARTYSGITEFRDTKYVAVSSSDLSTDATFAGMNETTMATTDTFFAAASAAPTFSAGDFTCAVTADATITMDFTAPAVAAIQTTCDGDKNRFSNYAMCNSDTLQTAMNKLWN